MEGCIRLRLIPTGAAALIAASLLAGCEAGDPYAELPFRPAGYWGRTQLIEEQATGCLYSINTRATTQERPIPLIRPDGSHIGCRQAAQPASPIPGYAADAIGEVNKGLPK